VELMTALQVFDFRGQKVRTAGDFDRPLFCAADVCAVLAIANVGDALGRLAANDVEHVVTTDVQGKNRRISYVTEAGLYKLVMRSRKAEAEAFVDWLTGEVLPAIRKHGFYSAVEAERERQTELLLAQCFPNLPSKSEPIFRELISALLGVRRERGASANPPWARSLASTIYHWAIRVDGQQQRRRALNPKPCGSRTDHSMFGELAEDSVKRVVQTGCALAKLSASWADWKTKMAIVFENRTLQFPFPPSPPSLPSKRDPKRAN
jgi:prophage antirepressor-like protein